MTNNYYQKKQKKKLSKKVYERYQNLSEEKKTKSANIIMTGIEIFLKKKTKRSKNIVMKDIRIFWRMSIEKFFLKCKKQRLSEYKTFFIISTLG